MIGVIVGAAALGGLAMLLFGIYLAVFSLGWLPRELSLYGRSPDDLDTSALVPGIGLAVVGASIAVLAGAATVGLYRSRSPTE